MKPHFLVLLVLTYSLATRTVWNTNDDRYSSFALLSNVATFLGFACFDIILLPLGQCGILSMIDTPVSLY